MRNYKKYLITMGLVWAGSLVLFVIAYIFLISPQTKTKAELNRQLAEKQRLCNSAIDAANDENKKKLAAEIESLKIRLANYAADFEESANLTFDISRLAGDTQLGSFTVKTPDQSWGNEQIDSKNLQENRIDVSFTSDYKKFATFLNSLERHRPVIFINKFKLTRGEQGLTGGKVDMDLSFFVKKKNARLINAS